MSQTHYSPVKLIYGKNTNAFYSIGTPNSLVVFVHGFGGNTKSTFNDFHNLMQANAQFEFTDFIFYGYESLKSQADYHAASFYKFIRAVTNPKFIKKTEGREITNAFNYDRIIIVAHSLGSLLARRALINGYGQNDLWIQTCRLVFFAPAHSGARVINLAMQSMPGLKSVFGFLSMSFAPILDDLEPESLALRRLKADTEQVLVNSGNTIGQAYSVLIGQNDNIVYNIPFVNHDPPATPIPGKGHINICKPRHGVYELPVLEVINAL